jgi:hypothetical protein
MGLNSKQLQISSSHEYANFLMTSLQVNDKIQFEPPNIYGAYFLFDIL